MITRRVLIFIILVSFLNWAMSLNSLLTEGDSYSRLLFSQFEDTTLDKILGFLNLCLSIFLLYISIGKMAKTYWSILLLCSAITQIPTFFHLNLQASTANVVFFIKYCVLLTITCFVYTQHLRGNIFHLFGKFEIEKA